jgi:hypothetical protein
MESKKKKNSDKESSDDDDDDDDDEEEVEVKAKGSSSSAGLLKGCSAGSVKGSNAGSVKGSNAGSVKGSKKKDKKDKDSELHYKMKEPFKGNGLHDCSDEEMLNSDFDVEKPAAVENDDEEEEELPLEDQDHEFHEDDQMDKEAKIVLKKELGSALSSKTRYRYKWKGMGYHIFAQRGKMTKIKINVHITDTIENIKNIIWSVTDIPPKNQRIRYNEIELEDGVTVLDTDIKAGDTVFMSVKVQGG